VQKGHVFINNIEYRSQNAQVKQIQILL